MVLALEGEKAVAELSSNTGSREHVPAARSSVKQDSSLLMLRDRWISTSLGNDEVVVLSIVRKTSHTAHPPPRELRPGCVR